MKNILSFLSTLLLVGILAAPAAYAKDKATPTPPPRRTVIASISSSSITMDTGTRTKNYDINKHTKCYYNGNAVKPDELRVGMLVSITPGFNGKTAVEIRATDAPPIPNATPTPKK